MNEHDYTGHTPGPWHWFGNTQSKQFYLATPDRGRQFVMTFYRYGIQGAQPAFQFNGIMHKASELCRYEVGDPGVIGAEQARANSTVYRKDVSGIDNPDARLMADAWMIPGLLAEREDARADLAASRARITQLEAVVEAALRLASTDPDGATGSSAPDSLTPEYALVDANCWRALRAALDTSEICTAVAAMQTGRGEGNVPDTKEVQHG
jgi:hypothetical protein